MLQVYILRDEMQELFHLLELLLGTHDLKWYDSEPHHLPTLLVFFGWRLQDGLPFQMPELAESFLFLLGLDRACVNLGTFLDTHGAKMQDGSSLIMVNLLHLV